MTSAPTTRRLLGDQLEHWAATTPEAEAMRYGDGVWSWAAWRDRVHRVSGALQASGVGRGDRVAFLDKNNLACLEVTFGAAAIGAAHAIVNFRLSPTEVSYIVRDCGAKVLFIGAELLDVLKEIRDELTEVEQVVVVGGPDDEYESWLKTGTPTAATDEVTPEDVCLLMYTSGTTGFPKGAMLTHHGVNTHTEAVLTVFLFDQGDRNLVAMPLFHVGGTCYAMLGVHGGMPTTVTREPDAASLFGALAGGATHAFLVPAVIAGIMQAGEQAVAAMSRLKFLGYGASPMPLPLLRSALAAWPQMRLAQVYGMTEFSGVVTTLNPDQHRQETYLERLASAGVPLPGIETRVVDPATELDVEQAQPGELWFRTDQRMAGYWGNPEASAQTITTDGWVRTGDIGRRDADGFIYIVDRVKDMIITGGENVYSPEVEQVLAEHPDIAEVAVIGVPDDAWGEAVMAFVAPLPGHDIDAAEVIAFARERLAHYKCPTTVEPVVALPRNGAGKILKRDLRKPYWADRSRNV